VKIPVPILETDHLLIRQYGLKDAAALHRMMKANRDQLLHTFPQSVRGTFTLMKTRQYVLEKQGDRRAGNILVCGVFLREEEKLIGHVLFTKFDWTVPKCDAGYFIDAGYSGKGYATEAARALVKWGFTELKLEKITMRIWPENESSIAVAKKLGAVKIGLAKRDFRSYDGKVMDCVYYEIYR
jgi:RimJ/RimL family protein N-acetyltransferase